MANVFALDAFYFTPSVVGRLYECGMRLNSFLFGPNSGGSGGE